MRPAKGPPASNVAKQKETVSKKVYFIFEIKALLIFSTKDCCPEAVC